MREGQALPGGRAGASMKRIGRITRTRRIRRIERIRRIRLLDFICFRSRMLPMGAMLIQDNPCQVLFDITIFREG